MATTKHSAHLYLDPPLMDWLRARAERRCCSVSQVVRDLVLDRIHIETATPQKEGSNDPTLR